MKKRDFSILIVIGARPQFIKYAPLAKELNKIKNLNQIVVHTGQHYDKNMSKVFFDDLGIPEPNINLNINNFSRGKMIGKMIDKIEEAIIKYNPNLVIIFGDTNSTLAAAVASSSFNLNVMHIEAGLRSFNKYMPEEHNRIVADHLSNILCVTSEEPKKNLINEGFSKESIFSTGDIMLDTFLLYKEKIIKINNYKKFGLKKNNYIICTIHRQENTHSVQRLTNIFKSLNYISKHISQVIIPLHPATKNKLSKTKIDVSNVKIIDPKSYLDFMSLVAHSNYVITDSGGLQKEAFYLEKQSLVLRTESEWVELSQSGNSILVDPNNYDDILNAASTLFDKKTVSKNLYGDGTASIKISKIINNLMSD